ncbi:hypothetical protein [Roseococcus pinisoli]|uniref:Flagellar protein FlgN n=1 Tax=Roseococcus pinisoli TaxID=2835040 RepID=A0ABS5QBN0_9PROT|nr:hypothetical protein [Roseococcus pinisoli]MBS7811095.1 hypothetical protein [Roseococcus pinisoli]
MMDAVIAAGERLAEALRAENEALAALDLSRAAALATHKMQATDALAAATVAARSAGSRAGGETRALAERIALALADLGRENRRLLETAIDLQSRVIETIAGAARPLSAPPGYGRSGARRPPHRPPALATATRA